MACGSLLRVQFVAGPHHRQAVMTPRSEPESGPIVNPGDRRRGTPGAPPAFLPPHALCRVISPLSHHPALGPVNPLMPHVLLFIPTSRRPASRRAKLVLSVRASPSC